jgi:hypothetical protein
VSKPLDSEGTIAASLKNHANGYDASEPRLAALADQLERMGWTTERLFQDDGTKATFVKVDHGGKVRTTIYIDGSYARVRAEVFYGRVKDDCFEWDDWRTDNLELDADIWPALDYVRAYLEDVAVPDEKDVLYLNHQRLLNSYERVLADRDAALTDVRLLKALMLHKGYLTEEEATENPSFDAPRDWA